MLRDWDDPMDLFALVPVLCLAMEPVLAHLDPRLDNEVLSHHGHADLCRPTLRTVPRGWWHWHTRCG
jgi:hypothetical protein